MVFAEGIHPIAIQKGQPGKSILAIGTATRPKVLELIACIA
jgi:hypothetical protein